MNQSVNYYPEVWILDGQMSVDGCKVEFPTRLTSTTTITVRQYEGKTFINGHQYDPKARSFVDPPTPYWLYATWAIGSIVVGASIIYTLFLK